MKTVVLLVGVLLLASLGGGQQPSDSLSPAAHKDVLATAESDPSLSLFVLAARSSGMAQTLRAADHVTVLAFSDRAITQLPPKMRQSFLDRPSLFRPILSRYVLSGELSARALAGHTSVKSHDGSTVKIDTRGGKLRVEGSEIGRSDIACSNGVIHVIDSLETGVIDRLLSQLRPHAPGTKPRS
jgi:uncharacterized surface protein with fasciclin (FAS1) repeats